MSKVIRITSIKKELESLIEREDHTVLLQWIKLSKSELEHRLRYSKLEETYVLQGSLRMLDDLEEVLKR